MTDLAELTDRLERTADRLRGGELDAEEAATALDREARAVAAEPAPGQDRLL